ncbi:hypothetical protein [Sulfurovum sp.]|uniref:hypothetical protein n=1 Tax=Sulfurovum sp. TaxID=1969726 RepID=UPI003567E3D3
MHPKQHPLLNPKNLLELVFQSPFWLLMYGTGGIFILSAFAWVFYGLGLHVHPKLYPLPHIAILDFISETMIWLRKESGYSVVVIKLSNFILAIVALIGIPYLFLKYASYLFWLWMGEDAGWRTILG